MHILIVKQNIAIYYDHDYTMYACID